MLFFYVFTGPAAAAVGDVIVDVVVVHNEDYYDMNNHKINLKYECKMRERGFRRKIVI